MLSVYIVWNVIVLLIYGFDKFAAKREMWRISEKTLFLTAFFMGAIGAFLGMELFRHKTKHTSFKILIPLFCVMNLVFMYFLLK